MRPPPPCPPPRCREGKRKHLHAVTSPPPPPPLGGGLGWGPHELPRIPDPALSVHAGRISVSRGDGLVRIQLCAARRRPLVQDPGLLHHRHLSGRRSH